MPKLWNATIETHRHAVREAVLDATAVLVAEHGLSAVTMSRVAGQTGVGRATLYKYFPDARAILLAWHERRIAGHLAQLTEVRDRAGPVDARLQAVLEAYAGMSANRRGHADTDLAAFLHRDHHVAQAHERLRNLIRGLLVEGVRGGEFRTDVAADELVAYCLHALTATRSQGSRSAVSRLVTVILAGLRPESV